MWRDGTNSCGALKSYADEVCNVAVWCEVNWVAAERCHGVYRSRDVG